MLQIEDFFFSRGNADEIINKYHQAKTRYETTREEFNNVKKNLQVSSLILLWFILGSSLK